MPELGETWVEVLVPPDRVHQQEDDPEAFNRWKDEQRKNATALIPKGRLAQVDVIDDRPDGAQVIIYMFAVDD